MANKNLKFNNGFAIPLIGLGTSLVPSLEEMEAVIENALDSGYRHIDTSFMYKNETAIGRVLKRWLDSGKLKREELFVVSKLPWTGMRPELVEHFVKLSLEALQLSYLDLYLIHWPFALQHTGNDYEIRPMKDGKVILDHESDIETVWKSLEHTVDKNLVKSIGISNFTVEQVERIVKVARIHPANLQIESHVYFQQVELREVCKAHGIVVTGYSPLGSPGRPSHHAFLGRYIAPEIFEDVTVLEIAQRYEKTPAQVLLRFLTQLDIVVIPKTTNRSRMKENLESLLFDLSDSDMEKLKVLDKGEDGRALISIPGSELHKDCPFRSSYITMKP